MSDIASDPGARSVTVTIKYGKGYEETWAVFRGLPAEVRDDIIAFFGIDDASVTGLTLNELVVNATSIAHGAGNVAASLGAVVLASGGATQTAAPVKTEPSAPEAAPEPPSNAAILAQIEAAPDADALKRLWAENQAAFQDAAVMAAWKAKGKALSG